MTLSAPSPQRGRRPATSRLRPPSQSQQRQSQQNQSQQNQSQQNQSQQNRPQSGQPLQSPVPQRRGLQRPQPKNQQPQQPLAKQPQAKQPQAKQTQSKQPQSKQPQSKQSQSKQSQSKQSQPKRPGQTPSIAHRLSGRFFGAPARSNAPLKPVSGRGVASSTMVGRSVSPRSIDASSTLPAWLRRLIFIERSSAGCLLLLGIATFTVYSWTVQSQRMWGEAYSQLDHLRSNEPQVASSNEVLKQQLANEAETDRSGLTEPNPGNVFYLEPSPIRPAPTVVTPAPATVPVLPLSY